MQIRSFLYICILSLLLTFPTGAKANVSIEQFTTPKGLDVWFVESKAIPMISVELSFRGGSSFDLPQREGLSSYTAALMSEGAGSLDAAAFQEELDRIGAKFGASTDKLNMTISLKTLSENAEAAFYLAGLAVRTPRFDAEPAARVRDQILAGLKRDDENPARVASRTFRAAMYGDHPYANPVAGTQKTVPLFIAKNAAFFHQNFITRQNMTISVVGDISKDKLSKLLDDNFADLSRGTKRQKIAQAPTPPFPAIHKVQMPIPQSHIMMGHLGISRHDPDYFAAFMLNYILGGGGFNSRLMTEVREKRGLAYNVYSYFEPLPHAGSFTAVVQTNNADAKKTIQLMRAEIARIRAEGVTEEEYKNATDYLTGSFPLRIDSNAKILGYLSTMQMENLGDAYLSEWQNRIRAVSRDDLKRVAKRLLHPENLMTVIVGDGEALEAYEKNPW